MLGLAGARLGRYEGFGRPWAARAAVGGAGGRSARAARAARAARNGQKRDQLGLIHQQ